VNEARFKGWPDEALEFFEGLEADNTKAYWQGHRDTYDKSVRGPMDLLIAEVQGEFGTFKVFRPYRDVRFSGDKSPYKTQIAAASQADVGAYYVQFGAEGLHAAVGAYHMGKDQLGRYRSAVDGAAGEELESIAAALVGRGYPISGETLKRAPKGWPAGHPRIGLLRHTSLTVGRQWPPVRWMATHAALQRIAGVWREAGPLLAWLATNVGPAADPGAR
jgi:uncharacterized protein (TIGR02453 family)